MSDHRGPARPGEGAGALGSATNTQLNTASAYFTNRNMLMSALSHWTLPQSNFSLDQFRMTEANQSDRDSNMVENGVNPLNVTQIVRAYILD